LLFIAFVPPPDASAANTVSVIVNGERIAFAGQGPVIVDGRTLVPVRGVFEALGFVVDWNDSARSVTIARGDDVITITLNSSVFYANGVGKTLDVPAQTIGGRVLLPLRLVLESVGYVLIWDGEGNTVVISGADDETDFFQLYANGDRSLTTLIGIGYSDAQLEEVVFSRMNALRGEYPNGKRWTNENYYEWKGGHYHGYGCVAFAFILSDAAFGDLPARVHYDFNKIRVGDVIRINGDSHSVIVLEVNNRGITIAEGNYNSSIHWGRTFTWERINNIANYIFTRYPE